MASTPTEEVAVVQPSVVNHQPAAARLISLDLLRGATIAAMILVNNPGDELATYWPLQHAHWNGWTPTDLIFPFFLFISGVSMIYSLNSRLQRDESKGKLFRHVLWRGLVIAALGLFLSGFSVAYHFTHWRVYGVLQRIAVCYVISAALVLWTGRRTQILAILGCLAGYWVLMRYVPVPGFGLPTRDIPLLDPDRNLVAWLDRRLLYGHLYEVTRDPEGLLSTIPAIATSLLGALTGQWLRSARTATTKALGMLAAGVVGIAAGEFFNLWFPINKKLWTSSFVLFTAGVALVCLAVSYFAADIKLWRGRWTKPFLVFGMNAIASYFLAEMLALVLGHMTTTVDGASFTWQEFIFQGAFAELGSPAFASLLFALLYVLFCWLVMWQLYRRKIFIKV